MTEQPNYSYIDSMSGGDMEFRKKLLSVIKLEFPEEKKVYLENIGNAKLKSAAENVHKLKHKISILGLAKSYEQANNYELSLIEGSEEGRTDFENVLQTITDFLSSI